VALEEWGGGRGDDDGDRPATRQLRDERRGEDHVAEEGRLDHERVTGGHVPGKIATQVG
jgi:hypothetical protein